MGVVGFSLFQFAVKGLVAGEAGIEEPEPAGLAAAQNDHGLGLDFAPGLRRKLMPECPPEFGQLLPCELLDGPRSAMRAQGTLAEGLRCRSVHKPFLIVIVIIIIILLLISLVQPAIRTHSD
jgi:hypothetical protein